MLVFCNIKFLSQKVNLQFLRVPSKNCGVKTDLNPSDSCFENNIDVYSLFGLIMLWGGHFVEFFSDCEISRDLARKEVQLVSLQESFAEVEIFELQTRT